MILLVYVVVATKRTVKSHGVGSFHFIRFRITLMDQTRLTNPVLRFDSAKCDQPRKGNTTYVVRISSIFSRLCGDPAEWWDPLYYRFTSGMSVLPTR